MPVIVQWFTTYVYPFNVKSFLFVETSPYMIFSPQKNKQSTLVTLFLSFIHLRYNVEPHTV